MHGMLLLVGIYIAQAVLARGPNLIGTSQPVTVSRNPRFWGSREQRIRHVPRMYGHADRFVYRIYTYGFLSRLLVASLGALHGMHAPSLDRSFSEACGCPKTPFCGKCTLERPEIVLAYLHIHLAILLTGCAPPLGRRQHRLAALVGQLSQFDFHRPATAASWPPRLATRFGVFTVWYSALALRLSTT